MNSNRFSWLLPIGLLGTVLASAGCGSDDDAGGTQLPSAGSSNGNDAPSAGAGSGGGPTATDSFGGSSNTGDNIFDMTQPGAAGAETFNPVDACVAEEANTQPTPAFVELLVDTSLSMGQSVAGNNNAGQPSKWDQTREVLVSALAQMSAETAVGLAFYPDVAVGAAACFDGEQDVALELLAGPDSDQRKNLDAAFDAQDPDGSTPTHDAYVYSLEQFEGIESIGGRFVVLITDGEPTFGLDCSGTGLPGNAVETGPLIEEAAKALEADIKTFVIGSPGSEDARESLSRMAEAGGTGTAGCSHDGPNYCHFDMTQQTDFAEALAGALENISGQTTSCSYPVPTPPNGAQLDPAKVNVVFTSANDETETLSQAAGDECLSGWQYSDDNSLVVLCPSTCEDIQAKQGQLALAFGCETVQDAPL